MGTSRQGFTLIELVVASLIIGLLAVVLIPNALGARAKGNDATVQTFLRKVLEEQEDFYIENGFYFPEGGTATGGLRFGDEVSFGSQHFVREFLESDEGASTHIGGNPEWLTVFPFEIPPATSFVIRTNVPDAHSGYCIIARWDSTSTETHQTFMATPTSGVQVVPPGTTAADCRFYAGEVADE